MNPRRLTRAVISAALAAFLGAALLALGAEAEILEPVELREQLKSTTGRLAAMYLAPKEVPQAPLRRTGGRSQVRSARRKPSGDG